MCLNDFHSGILRKGPEERADGDHDQHLRVRDSGGTHTAGNDGGRGPSSAAPSTPPPTRPSGPAVCEYSDRHRAGRHRSPDTRSPDRTTGWGEDLRPHHFYHYCGIKWPRFARTPPPPSNPARSGPNMPNPRDCVHLSHMAAPKPSAVTRISSQTHLILVTVDTCQPPLQRHGIEKQNCHGDRIPDRYSFS